jgi:integrase/recombinase XerD
MIDSIFVYGSSKARQRSGALLRERELYLAHMLREGVSKERVRTIASMLVHITRLLNLTTLRPIEMSELEEGGQRWLSDDSHKMNRMHGSSTESFLYTARNWFRFHQVLVVRKGESQYADLITQEFRQYMKETIGLSPNTVRRYGSTALCFLRWSSDRHNQVEAIGVRDVDDFIAMQAATGCRPSTLGSDCSALRFFFKWTEFKGWNSSKVARSIKSPKVQRCDTAPQGPPWKDVRRLLNSFTGTKTADLRAAAVFSLCSIYGIRSGEVANLTLEDFDWVSETFTVRRVKRGRVQQFPIQFEVGEAILRYLQHGRPRCSCRNLFVTLRPPYRPIRSATLWWIVAPRLKNFGITSEHYGAHSLRHACATQLLSRGSSLKDIADFLGHRDMKSVSIYAKHDMRSLEQVAIFSLAGVR